MLFFYMFSPLNCHRAYLICNDRIIVPSGLEGSTPQAGRRNVFNFESLLNRFGIIFGCICACTSTSTICTICVGTSAVAARRTSTIRMLSGRGEGHKKIRLFLLASIM